VCKEYSTVKSIDRTKAKSPPVLVLGVHLRQKLDRYIIFQLGYDSFWVQRQEDESEEPPCRIAGRGESEAGLSGVSDMTIA